MKLTCVLIGLGQIGLGYDIGNNDKSSVLTHAKSIHLCPDIDLLAAVDLDPTKRKIFEKYYNVETYSNIAEALRNCKPNIIIVATPSNDHLATVETILGEHKPLVIVCEKPIDTNIENARKIVSLCKEHKIQLYINYMRRSEHGVNNIKKMFINGEIQGPIKGVAWYSKGIVNNGSHLINLLEYWLGHIKDVSDVKFNRNWNDNDFEVDVKISFELGAVTFLSVWDEFFPHLSIELMSPSGRLQYNKSGEEILWQPSHATSVLTRNTYLEETEGIANHFDRYQQEFVYNLVRSISGHASCISEGKDALNTLEWVHKIRTRILNGKR